jgi:hypothetical protein
MSFGLLRITQGFLGDTYLFIYIVEAAACSMSPRNKYFAHDSHVFSTFRNMSDIFVQNEVTVCVFIYAKTGILLFFTLLVPYILNYTYLMQTNVHCFMLFNTIFIKCCPTCF